ncbi:MAG TPA: hypothetical protein VIT22_09265 [Pseudoxanthomonas sp.]
MDNHNPFPSASPPLCIGHSHLRCVQMASAESDTPIDAVNFWDNNALILNSPENPVLVEELQKKVLEHRGTVFSYIGGGAHTVIALVSHPRRYDFVLPEHPDLPMDPRAEVLPVDAVRAALMAQTEPYLKLMRHVRSLAQRRMAHMEPPPPCPDNEQIAPHIPWSLFPGLRQEIAPPHLRYKVWRLHSDIVSALCREEGIEFLAYPLEAADDDGFMRQDYFFDGVHANSGYGLLQLRQMQEAA